MFQRPLIALNLLALLLVAALQITNTGTVFAEVVEGLLVDLIGSPVVAVLYGQARALLYRLHDQIGVTSSLGVVQRGAQPYLRVTVVTLAFVGLGDDKSRLGRHAVIIEVISCVVGLLAVAFGLIGIYTQESLS